jgi:CrcB protein
MLRLAAVAVGAALGANLRYTVALWAARRWGSGFPWGTLIINVSGSLLIGIAIGLAASRLALTPTWRLLIVTGFCGGYTTFSTFAYETYELINAGSVLRAALNATGSLLLGILAVVAGIVLARLVP